VDFKARFEGPQLGTLPVSLRRLVARPHYSAGPTVTASAFEARSPLFRADPAAVDEAEDGQDQQQTGSDEGCQGSPTRQYGLSIPKA
jgi:hypothetical protein